MITKPTLSLPTSARLLARRRWLKGTGALLGLAVLGAPAQALALAPEATAGAEAIGTVKLLTGTVVPQGWMLCEGQSLVVDQNPELFTVLGATYGGDGRRTFALPDMRNDMAALAALDGSRPAGAVPMGRLCAIKVANAPATTTAVAELQLVHLSRFRRAAA
jgi:hypothetical protein